MDQLLLDAGHKHEQVLIARLEAEGKQVARKPRWRSTRLLPVMETEPRVASISYWTQTG